MQKKYMRVVFYLPKNTICASHFNDLNHSNFAVRVIVVPWSSSYSAYTTVFIKSRTRVQRWFKSFLWHVRDSQWWGCLIIVLTGNWAKHLSPFNHTTRAIHHQFTTSLLCSKYGAIPHGNDINRHFNRQITYHYFLQPPYFISIGFEMYSSGVLYITARTKYFEKCQRPVVFPKQPMKIRAPLRFKIAVLSSASNSCIKFYTCFC